MATNTLHYQSLIKSELQDVESLLLTPHRDIPDVVQNAIHAVILGGGKRIRPALALLSAHLCGVQPATITPLAAAVELLHTATLIHDDLIDEAATRRGVETLNSHWPASAAVLAGDLVFSWAAQLAARAGNPRLMQRFAETLSLICAGELNQMFQGRGHVPTPEIYYHRVLAKTASLFIISTESAAILAQCTESEAQRLARFGELLGVSFQIADDVLDFMGDAATLGKPVGSDLRQGLITLPILLYMQSRPEDGRILTLLRDPTDTLLVDAVLADLRQSDAAEQAMAIAGGYIQEATEILHTYPPTPHRDALEEIATFAVRRRY